MRGGGVNARLAAVWSPSTGRRSKCAPVALGHWVGPCLTALVNSIPPQYLGHLLRRPYTVIAVDEVIHRGSADHGRSSRLTWARVAETLNEMAVPTALSGQQWYASTAQTLLGLRARPGQADSVVGVTMPMQIPGGRRLLLARR